MYLAKNRNKNHISLSQYPVFFLISFGLFVASLTFRLLLCGNIAAKNYGLKDMVARKQALEKEIASLSYENLKLSSIQQIEVRAKSLGFVEMTGALLALDIKSSPPLAVASTSR
jgi:hypothetical protein